MQSIIEPEKKGNSREELARDLIEIAGAIKQNKDGSFTVDSQWCPEKSYTVARNSCTCPDFVYRKNRCKHIIAVEIHVARLAKSSVAKVVA